jgi:hypothetical protein
MPTTPPLSRSHDRGRHAIRPVVVLAWVVALVVATPGAAPPQPVRDAGTIPGPASGPLRVVVIGDFGEQSDHPLEGARAVAAAVLARHNRQGLAYHFGITVGDNFYPRGVRSETELKQRWEATGYPKLNLPFYATLGNHDYAGNEGAQIGSLDMWRMPSTYYTFAAGHARFFALDTDEGTTGRWNPFFLFGLIPRSWSSTQRDWLAGALRAHANATWKIVYGHHPIYSDGRHGNTSRLLKRGGLLDTMREARVDLFVAGHDHDLQYHAPGPDDGSMHFIVAGGGGRELRAIELKHAAFVKSAFGFAELEITERTLTLRILDSAGQVLHEPEPLSKPSSAAPGRAPR